MGGCMEDSYLMVLCFRSQRRHERSRCRACRVRDRKATRSLARRRRLGRLARDRAFAKKQTSDLRFGVWRERRRFAAKHYVRRRGASALRRRRDGGPWEGWTGESVAGFRIHVSGGPMHGRNAGAWHASTFVSARFPNELANISPSEAVKPPRAGPDPTTDFSWPTFRCSDRRTPTTRPRSARHPGSALSVGGPRWRTRTNFPNQTRTTTLSTSTVRGGARTKAPVCRRPVSAVCCRWRGRTRGG